MKVELHVTLFENLDKQIKNHHRFYQGVEDLFIVCQATKTNYGKG